jgi:hypothetical protein
MNARANCIACVSFADFIRCRKSRRWDPETLNKWILYKRRTDRVSAGIRDRARARWYINLRSAGGRSDVLPRSSCVYTDIHHYAGARPLRRRLRSSGVDGKTLVDFPQDVEGIWNVHVRVWIWRWSGFVCVGGGRLGEGVEEDGRGVGGRTPLITN